MEEVQDFRIKDGTSISRNRSEYDPQQVVYDPEVAERLQNLDSEIESVNQQISQLQKLKKTITRQRDELYSDYVASLSKDSDPSKSRRTSGIDYTKSDFPWSAELSQTAKDVFGIASFRMCQEAVCNSALDSRDSVVVMPTGGGKSLCYQLPALLASGLTLVVSPLISLMTDQVLHLRDNGISCELLAGSVSREDSTEILRRIKNASQGGTHDESEIKLLYVTPERIAKSKTLLSTLQKAYEQGSLARIVIDEAHCCSQMGHDYRPDYKKLSILRKLFPEVPIMCLTATCGPTVLGEILEIINLSPTTEPHNAAPRRTLYFTAPLFRPNLVYSVLQRPQNNQAAAQSIADYIKTNYTGKSGIVYCLSKKDTHTMADALSDLSHGAIKTGVYHADLEDSEKQQVHLRWRDGRISVVCATIAFGMGIDKGDVRFVIHACISKSLDGYYQETGRAGRDGKQASCVLMYRPQDATRISGLVAGEPTGQEKLHAMLDFAQSPRCRKQLFSDYFADTFGGPDKCGICDNCQTEAVSQDVSFQAWQVVKVATEVHENGGRCTLSALADLSRGLGGGKYSVDGSKKGKAKSGAGGSQVGVLDLAKLVGGKVNLSKDNCERLIVQLHLHGYLADEYHATAYTVNVYARPGRSALRLTRLTVDQARQLTDLVKVSLVGLEKRGKQTNDRKEVSTSRPARGSTKFGQASEEEIRGGFVGDRQRNGDDAHEDGAAPVNQGDEDDDQIPMARRRKKRKRMIDQDESDYEDQKEGQGADAYDEGSQGIWDIVVSSSSNLVHDEMGVVPKRSAKGTRMNAIEVD